MAIQLVSVHKVMIGASVGVCLLFALWAGWMYRAQHTPVHLVMGGLALCAGVALITYLRYFVRKRLR